MDLCRDPTDVPALGTALAGGCALLISVDRDLLDMQTIQDISIIRPGEYWRRGSSIDLISGLNLIRTSSTDLRDAFI
jgi:predicted nucleic acid-binding protein